MANRKPLKIALQRPLRAAAIIVGHLSLGAVLVLGLFVFEQLFAVLWGDQEPTFFGWVPVKWFFHASELGVMGTYVFWGVYEANEELRH